jgi:hypothetical protein
MLPRLNHLIPGPPATCGIPGVGLWNTVSKKNWSKSIVVTLSFHRNCSDAVTLSAVGLVLEEKISIKVRRRALSGEDITPGTADDQGASTIELATAVAFRRRGTETRLLLPGLTQQKHGERYDPALIKAIARLV